MATPIMTGNAQAQQYLMDRYRKLHYHNMFMFNPGISKKEAHAAAFNEMRRRMGK
jgi:hypothetical protein